MIKYLVLLCVIYGLSKQNLSAQTAGYLGSKNGFMIQYNMLPSQAYTAKQLDGYVKYRWKWINQSFAFSYSRAMSKKVQLTAGYQFAKINFYAGHRFFGTDGELNFSNYWGGSNTTYVFSEHANANYHGGFFAFDFFRHGSMAPIGKYIGFSLNFGSMHLSDSTSFSYIYAANSGSQHLTYHNYTTGTQEPINLVIDEEKRITSFQLKIRMGRMYPITDHIILNVGMSAPLFSTYRVDNLISEYGFNLRDENKLNFNNNYEKTWEEYAMRSLRIYHLLQLEVGLKICL